MAKLVEGQKDKKQSISNERKTNPVPVSKDLLSIMDAFFDKRLGWIIWAILGISFIFCLLLFDSRVSLSGDDSFYIIRASDFIHSFKYPAFQGPLYPMVLSIFVAIFGISLIPLKILSLLSVLGFMYLFFVAFRNRIPSTLLVITLLAMSVNSFFLYYGSQTYNEAFYMIVMMFLILVFFQHFIDHEQVPTFKLDVKRHFIIAAVLLALTLTKNMGFSAVIAIFGYFLLRAQWKNLLYSIATFSLLFVAFQGVKYGLWNDGGMQVSSQGSGLMYKDYYNPQAGKEDLAGFYNRLIVNSNLYLSKHFMSIIGFRKAEPVMTVNSASTILIYLLAIGSLIITFRKNKYLFFTGLLTGSFLLITFIVLQVKWDQSRLIIPIIPLLLLMILSLFYYISKIEKYKLLQVMVPLVALLILFQSLAVTAVAAKENQAINGRYGGLTPDWKNYLKASEWAATNLPKDAIIACRKPSISFVYGNGRNFYGIMQIPAYSSGAFFKKWAEKETEYMLFNYAELSGKQLTQTFYSALKQNMDAMLFVGDTVFIVDKVNDSTRSLLTENANAIGFNQYSSLNNFKTTFNMSRDLKIFYPDSLLFQLQNAGVTHIITANLRRNSTQKDGMIINTVERYMAYIQEKYPSVFTKISQVGDDNNEPAIVYKVEYEKYGLKPKKQIAD
jgi:hypothetical protein